MEFYLKALTIFLEATKGKVHAILIGDDLGSQLDLMISPKLVEEFVIPGAKQLIDLAHSYGVKVIYHSCGSIVKAIPLLIDAGVDIIHPIQALAKGMQPENLKEKFEGKISFCGGVDTRTCCPTVRRSRCRQRSAITDNHEGSPAVLERQDAGYGIEGTRNIIFGNGHAARRGRQKTPPTEQLPWAGVVENSREFLLQLAVFLIGDRLQPFIGTVHAGDLQGQMGEPAVGSRAVPVLDAGGDVDHVAGMQFPGRLAPLLIVAVSGHAEQHLTAALLGLVDMPIVPAARLKGHIVHPHRTGGQGLQIALPHKILGKSIVGRADGEDHRLLVPGLFVALAVCRPKPPWPYGTPPRPWANRRKRPRG